MPIRRKSSSASRRRLARRSEGSSDSQRESCAYGPRTAPSAAVISSNATGKVQPRDPIGMPVAKLTPIPARTRKSFSAEKSASCPKSRRRLAQEQARLLRRGRFRREILRARQLGKGAVARDQFVEAARLDDAPV